MHLALIIHFPLPVKVNILAFALLLLNLGRYQITRKRGSCFFTAPKAAFDRGYRYLHNPTDERFRRRALGVQ